MFFGTLVFLVHYLIFLNLYDFLGAISDFVGAHCTP